MLPGKQRATLSLRHVLQRYVGANAKSGRGEGTLFELSN